MYLKVEVEKLRLSEKREITHTSQNIPVNKIYFLFMSWAASFKSKAIFSRKV